MTLDPEADAADQAIRDALDALRAVLADRGATSYLESVDYLKWALNEDRISFFDSVNGGGVWRNMGSIFDNANERTLRALVRLAGALDAAHLATKSTLQDADMIRGWFANELHPGTDPG